MGTDPYLVLGRYGVSYRKCYTVLKYRYERISYCYHIKSFDIVNYDILNFGMSDITTITVSRFQYIVLNFGINYRDSILNFNTL